MSECTECSQAAQGWHFGFLAACRGCQARMAARSPWYLEAKKAGRLTPAYRETLERFRVSHDEVKAAADADRLLTPKEGNA